MDPKYKQCKAIARIKNVRDIVNISRMVEIPQKTIYSAVDIYYKYIMAFKTSDSIIPIGAACIMLSGKMCGSLRSLEQILRTSYGYYKLDSGGISFEENYNKAIDIELRACIALDFDFKIKDLYGCLEKMCLDYNISKSVAQMMWIILNDSMYLPLTLVFCTKSIVISCMFVSSIIDNASNNLDCDIVQFKHSFGDITFNASDVIFISEEIISLYEDTLRGMLKTN